MAAFKPGFRCSGFDAFVLVAALVAAVALWWAKWEWLSLLIAVVVGHFFLFCNVFRISRALEALWVMLFFLIVLPRWKTNDSDAWKSGLGWLAAATFLVIVLELRKPSYHGVGWKWLNPRLGEWWEAQQSLRK